MDTLTPVTSAVERKQIAEELKKFAEHSATADGGSVMCFWKDDFTYMSTNTSADVEASNMAEMKFRWYSLTKPVIAVAACAVMEAGKCNLDDPVSKFLPDFAKLTAQTPAPVLDEKFSQRKVKKVCTEVIKSEDKDVKIPILGDVNEEYLMWAAKNWGLTVTSEQAEIDPVEINKKVMKQLLGATTPAGMTVQEQKDEVAMQLKQAGEFTKTTFFVSKGTGEGETEPVTTPMTIRNLLTHTSGLGYGPGVQYPGSYKDMTHQLYGDLCEETMAGKIPDLKTWVKKLSTIPLVQQPGLKHEYGFSMDVLGAVLEVIEKKTLAKVVQEYVLQPAGMTGTDWSVKDVKTVVPLYLNDRSGATDEDEEEFKEAEETPKASKKKGGKPTIVTLEKDGSEYLKEPKVLSGGGSVELVTGGLVGPIGDYVKFVKALMSDTEVFFSQSTKQCVTEVNHLPLATGDKVQELGKGRGWNLLGQVYHEPHQYETKKQREKREESGEEEKYPEVLAALSGSFQWGGFAGPRFAVYPKINAGFVFMRNCFGFRQSKLNRYFNVAALQMAGCSKEACLWTTWTPPKKGKGKGKGTNQKGKGKGKGNGKFGSKFGNKFGGANNSHKKFGKFFNKTAGEKKFGKNNAGMVKEKEMPQAAGS